MKASLAAFGRPQLACARLSLSRTRGHHFNPACGKPSCTVFDGAPDAARPTFECRELLRKQRNRKAAYARPFHSANATIHFEPTGVAASSRRDCHGCAQYGLAAVLGHSSHTHRALSSSRRANGEARPPFDVKLYDMGKMLKRGDIAGVLAIFQKLKESGTAKNLHYNVAMSALASARDWKSAGALFDELDARGETDTYSYGAYSSALCRAGKLKEAVALVDHMSSRQVTPNIVIYNTLLHGAITAGDLVLARRLKLDVQKLKLACSEMFLIGLLRLAASEGSGDDIAAVWRAGVGDMYSRGGSACSPAALAALCVAFAQCRRPKEAMRALRVLQRVHDGRVTRGEHATNTSWTKQYVDQADMWHAISDNRGQGKEGAQGAPGIHTPSAPETAREGRVRSSPDTYRTLSDAELAACRKSQEFGAMTSALVASQGVALAALEPTQSVHILAAFDSTLAGFRKAGDKEGAAEVVKMFVEAGLCPSASTFNALIHGAGGGGSVSGGSGGVASATPSAKGANGGARGSGWAQAGDGNRQTSKNNTRTSTSNAQTPNPNTHTSNMSNSTQTSTSKASPTREQREGDDEDVCVETETETETVWPEPLDVEKEVLGRMSDASIQPTPATHNAILGEQARNLGVKGLIGSWRRFEGMGWEPNTQSFNILLRAHSKAQDTDACWSVFEDMQKAKCRPNEATWVTLIGAHGRFARHPTKAAQANRDWAPIDTLFGSHRDTKPNNLREAGMLDHASPESGAREESKKTNKWVTLDVRVMRVLDLMRQHEQPHTVNTGTAMMRVFLQAGYTEEALALLEELEGAGLKVGVQTYNTVLNGLAEVAADADEADAEHTMLQVMRVLMRMRVERGMTVDRYSYNALIIASGTRSSGKMAQFFLAFTLASGLPPAVDSFNLAIRAALSGRALCADDDTSSHNHSSNKLSGSWPGSAVGAGDGEVSDGGLRQAHFLLDEMKILKLSANEITFRTIYRRTATLSKHLGTPLESNRLLQNAVDRGARPPAPFIKHIIEEQALNPRKARLSQGVWLLGLATGYELMPVNMILSLEQVLRHAIQASPRVTQHQRDRMHMSLEKIHHIALSRRSKKKKARGSSPCSSSSASASEEESRSSSASASSQSPSSASASSAKQGSAASEEEAAWFRP